MENIHNRNTLVIAFSCVAVGLWYTVFFILSTVTLFMFCEEPVALFMHESIIVRDSFGSCGHVCFP